MKTRRTNLFVILSAVFVVGGVSTVVGQKGAPSPIPPPINAKIVNTAAEPIPVTGSITASGGVSITNSPTVKIDETANTVVVRSAAEQALFLVYDITENRTFGVTTTKYSKVRVCVEQTSWFSRNVTIKSQASGTGQDNVDFVIDTLSLHGDLEDIYDHKCGVYEVPGKHMIIEVPRNTDHERPGSMRIVVFGYPN
jgi:hypothetical protein